MMAGWSFPGGPEKRGENWEPMQQCTQPRWAKPQWKSLAWATQLLVALDLFFAILIRSPFLGDAMWWSVLVVTAAVLALVSVLAVR